MDTTRPSLAWLLLLLQLCRPAFALENGLARRPPMGWMAWQRFTCQTDCESRPSECVSARLFREMADRLVEDGFRELGYEYVSIDDCWSELARNERGQLEPDRRRFGERGIGELAEYMHARKLKLGLYGDCGTRTCAGYPSQLAAADEGRSLEPTGATYFERDAHSLAHWQVDAFKFDGCYLDPLKAESVCPRMASALQSARYLTRPILLICEWPFYQMYAHARTNFSLAAQSCNLWRYYDDIEDSWSSILNTIDYTVKHQSTIVEHHGPGHWFDPDQLVVGNFGLSFAQASAQMAIWSIWAAPLFMGNDLRSLEPRAASLLKNERLIGVNQDELGVFGLMVGQSADGLEQAFVKPVLPATNLCPSFALVYLNRRSWGKRSKVSFELRDLLLAAPVGLAARRARQLDLSGQQMDARACLRRLAKAGEDGGGGGRLFAAHSSSSSGGRNNGSSAAEFLATDLLSGAALGRFRLDEPLALLVEPSSARALLLVEEQSRV